MSSFRHAIVVGASSGIGREVVRQLAESGTRVAALARRRGELESLAEQFPGLILPFEHDVTEYASIPSLFQEVTKDLGGLDLLVYSSGVMPPVGQKEFDFAKDRQMVEVNVLGGIAWCNQAAIRFQETRGGSIVGIASVAGDRGRSGQPVYNATKGAFAIYLEALRNRLTNSGVVVSTIKPGPVDTPMTAHLAMKGKQSAAEVATITLAKARKPGEHYTKFSHRVIFAVIRLIPGWIFRKLPI